MTAIKPSTPLPCRLPIRATTVKGQSLLLQSDGALIATVDPASVYCAAYIVAACNAYPRLEAENAKLREALRGLSTLCDNVPIFQLDGGKASVKAVRLAGKFTGALDKARALLRELGEGAA